MAPTAATTDSTHDASLLIWRASADDRETDVPIQNLPFGRFRREDDGTRWRWGKD